MLQLTALLNQLEAAVRAGDRVRALELARLVHQQLVRDQHDQAVVERRVRELLAELQAPAAPPRVVDFAAHEAVRGLAPAGEPGLVYPVWFGTNRKPNPLGTGFTGERHDRVTRGRVEVYVPEAHRFGETGTPFVPAGFLVRLGGDASIAPRAGDRIEVRIGSAAESLSMDVPRLDAVMDWPGERLRGQWSGAGLLELHSGFTYAYPEPAADGSFVMDIERPGESDDDYKSRTSAVYASIDERVAAIRQTLADAGNRANPSGRRVATNAPEKAPR